MDGIPAQPSRTVRHLCLTDRERGVCGGFTCPAETGACHEHPSDPKPAQRRIRLINTRHSTQVFHSLQFQQLESVLRQPVWRHPPIRIINYIANNSTNLVLVLWIGSLPLRQTSVPSPEPY
ncbi:hypothetical protein EMIT0324P_80090 [Pseudomonas chlororaphis]